MECNNKGGMWPQIAADNKSMWMEAPSECFELSVKGTAGTITVSRSADGIVWSQLSATYTMSGTSDSITMSGFPKSCKIKLVTTGTFTDGFIKGGKA